MEKRMNNQALLEQQLGDDVIDALAQANIDLHSVTLEQAKELLVRVGRDRRTLIASRFTDATRIA